MAGTTPNIGLNVPDHGDQNWDVPVNQNWNTLDTAIAGKQATLVSGTNIKTINNNSILGSGNVDIDALPSQTGQNGKFLTTNGTNASWANVPTRNIGEIVESTIPLTDAGLHLLDGSVISGSGAYAAFVTHIAGLVSGHSELFTTEANWQTSVTDYGACDKFVYDSTNNTVRLPKRVTDHGELIKSYSSGTDWYRIYSDGWCEQGGFLSLTTADVTTPINFIKSFADTNYTIITTLRNNNNNAGFVNVDNNSGMTTSGTYVRIVHKSSAACSPLGVFWQASGYTDISDLQQTPVYEYIVIANSVKTPVEVDIDEVMTDLNGKVDKSDLAPVQCIIDTYSSGTEWYRIWSDGWVEQGGEIAASTTSVTLLKPYLNTNYNVVMCGSNYGGSDQPLGTSARTVSGFTVSNTSYKRNWRACGYIS